MACDLPVRAKMCATCPFRVGSKYAYLKQTIEDASRVESRICHSTGQSAIYGNTKKPEAICRGSRDMQLQWMSESGFLSEATDEAWNEQRVLLGMKPQEIIGGEHGR